MTSLSGTMPILWTCFLFFWIPSIQGQISVEPSSPILVRLNKKLQILCRMPGELSNCRFEKSVGMERNSYVLRPKPDKPLSNEPFYYGAGMEFGECGLQINRVEKSHNGSWICALLSSNTSRETLKTIEIIVAEPPTNLSLVVSKSNSFGGSGFNIDQDVEIKCQPSLSSPPANVSIYLDDEKLRTSVSNVSMTYRLTPADHDKKVLCVVEHFALEKNLTKDEILDVQYSPQNIDEAKLKLFNFVIGRTEFINLTIDANPRPEVTWYVDRDQVKPGSYIEGGRFSAIPIQNLGKGKWLASLKIDGFQQVDADRAYSLSANNLKGNNEYEIHISLSSKSDAQGVDIDAGFIIGIVAGVLVLLLLFFLIIFARATGRWCFAGGPTPRNIGESDPAASVSLLQFKKIDGRRSDTESGRYSRTEVDSSKKPRMRLSNLFQRNKGSETMETVTAADEEKLPESEVITEKSTPQSEGGLVYAELDLTQRQVSPTPRSINNDKTEYAEIVCKKPEENDDNTPTK